MSERIEFETPENILIGYSIAGLGSRFIAWLLDAIIAFFLGLVIFILLILAGFGITKLFTDSIHGVDFQDQNQIQALWLHWLRLVYMTISLVSILYSGCSELFLRGQTVGKRIVGIRVVKTNGFRLDATSIALRNLFRVIDNLSLVWIVPLLSKHSQRLGDMVAGTVVVTDDAARMGSTRQHLAQRPAHAARFRFDAGSLRRARPQDTQAVEQILERWPRLTPQMRERLLGSVCDPLAKRLAVPLPAADDRKPFLEDFLAAAYRRRHRDLG